MSVAAALLASAMLLSFTAGFVGLIWDACGGNFDDRGARVITILYVWPVAVVVITGLGLALSAIWGSAL